MSIYKVETQQIEYWAYEITRIYTVEADSEEEAGKKALEGEGQSVFETEDCSDTDNDTDEMVTDVYED